MIMIENGGTSITWAYIRAVETGDQTVVRNVTA